MPKKNAIRIIAGEYRSRRVEFLDREGLRPTGDRVRETLFNWLQPWVAGATCLDLFAGSGALGFEALSRGAARVDFVERDSANAEQLRSNLKLLGSSHGQVHHMTAEQWLLNQAGQSDPHHIDIVFLDPPFAAQSLYAVAASLAAAGLLHARSLIYMEHPQEPQMKYLPEAWSVRRSKRSGDVHFWLCDLVTANAIQDDSAGV